jgi:hypothetical protein
VDARYLERSFPVERIEPMAPDRWSEPYRRFKHYVELACV